MRLIHLILGSLWVIAACVPRRPSVASVDGAPPAVSGTPMATPLPETQPVAIHQVAEIEPPAVLVASEPVPGFMRGINLGNALDAPQEGAWGVTLEEKHFAMAKAAGLDHIRLPVRSMRTPRTKRRIRSRIRSSSESTGRSISRRAGLVDHHRFASLRRADEKTRPARRPPGRHLEASRRALQIQTGERGLRADQRAIQRAQVGAPEPDSAASDRRHSQHESHAPDHRQQLLLGPARTT